MSAFRNYLAADEMVRGAQKHLTFLSRELGEAERILPVLTRISAAMREHRLAIEYRRSLFDRLSATERDALDETT